MRPPHLLLLALTLTSCASSTADLASETATIRAIDEAWFGAEKRRDIESIMPYVAEDAVFQPPDAHAFVGRNAVRGFYESLYALPFTDIGGGSDSIVVASSGDIAYDIGHNYIVLKEQQGERKLVGKYLAIWRKLGGSWKVSAISWSLDAPMK